MKKFFMLILVLVTVLSVSASAFAIGYSGSATNYFDTSSQNKSGSSWAKMTDTCYECVPYQGFFGDHSTTKEVVPVNGSIALAPRRDAATLSVVNFSWTSGANSYTSAKLRNYAAGSNIYTRGDWTAY